MAGCKLKVVGCGRVRRVGVAFGQGAGQWNLEGHGETSAQEEFSQPKLVDPSLSVPGLGGYNFDMFGKQ